MILAPANMETPSPQPNQARGVARALRSNKRKGDKSTIVDSVSPQTRSAGPAEVPVFQVPRATRASSSTKVPNELKKLRTSGPADVGDCEIVVEDSAFRYSKSRKTSERLYEKVPEFSSLKIGDPVYAEHPETGRYFECVIQRNYGSLYLMHQHQGRPFVDLWFLDGDSRSNASWDDLMLQEDDVPSSLLGDYGEDDAACVLGDTRPDSAGLQTCSHAHWWFTHFGSCRRFFPERSRH